MGQARFVPEAIAKLRIPPFEQARGTWSTVLGSAVVILSLLVSTLGIAYSRREAALVGAAQQLRAVDGLLTAETERTLQSVGLVLDVVVEQLDLAATRDPADFVARAKSPGVFDRLRFQKAGMPQLDAVTIVDADGRLVAWSRAPVVPDVRLDDRDYFGALRDGAATFLSAPVPNRGSGTPTIYVAHRITARDGSFAGMVLGAVALSSLERLYATLDLGPNGFVALWRRDGVLLARYPAGPVGQRVPVVDITPGTPTWHGVPNVFEKTWSMTGEPVTRIVASANASAAPVQVNVGRSKDVILMDWRHEVVEICAAVGFAVLCVAGLAAAVIRQARTHRTSVRASLDREEAILARQAVEDQLRQSQKMEAVGQLTGGVAHDFNNMLTIVRSSIDLLSRPDLPEARRARYLDAVSQTVDRATKLTSQLLSFARRQTLKPEVFDAVARLSFIADMIDPVMGARIRIVTKLPGDPCFVRADASQFETALVNMAVNARDAMGGEGVLTLAVETRPTPPPELGREAPYGRLVAISLSDTGVGIPPENLTRIFEPFYTTKDVGRGTGLGLSQVFGFAKQSGGDVGVASPEGRGATFTLYLPEVEAPEASATPQDQDPLPLVEGGGRRILVVEDNVDIGRFATQILDDLGYVTRLAVHAAEAIEILSTDEAGFDAVFSDVMMPGGMDGVALARELRRRHPSLPVVLTSGYSHVLAEEGTHGFDLIQKPYSADQLSRALGHAMNPPPRAAVA